MIMVIFGAGASYDSVPSRSPKIGTTGATFFQIARRSPVSCFLIWAFSLIR